MKKEYRKSLLRKVFRKGDGAGLLGGWPAACAGIAVASSRSSSLAPSAALCYNSFCMYSHAHALVRAWRRDAGRFFMLLLKIYWHLMAIVQRCCYKILYGSRVHFGRGVTWRKGFSLVIDGGHVRIGNGVFFNNNCSLTSQGEIEIGDDCILGENVKLYDHNHRFGGKTLIKNQGFSKGGAKNRPQLLAGQ